MESVTNNLHVNGTDAIPSHELAAVKIEKILPSALKIGEYEWFHCHWP